MRNVMDLKESAIKSSLLNGNPIIVYDFDGREEEADMVFFAGAVNWQSINRLRIQAGGLICYVIGKEEADKLGLDFMVDILLRDNKFLPLIKKPSYGDYPSFSLWVNSTKVRTGINDHDRALTIRELHNLIIGDDSYERFRREFYSPGHVPILISRGIENRRGHTELVTALAEYLNLPRSMVIAEMLDSEKSLPKNKAISFALQNNLIFIEGKNILEMVK